MGQNRGVGAATRGDFQNEPIEDPVPMTPPRRVWTDEEWATIRNGLVPQSMDDRWFAFTEHSTVYLHRSWTGIGIYQAQFEQVDDGWIIVEAVAARGHEDTALLERTIDVVGRGPLDDSWRFPSPGDD